MSLRSLTHAFGVFFVLFVSASEAGAFCRARTCNPTDPKQTCETDADDCITSGSPLYWSSSCVSFSVQEDGSRVHGITASAATAAARNALGAWTGVNCGGDLPSIGFADHGLVSCDASEFNQDGYNANAIIFRDEVWPYPGASDTYGFTRIRFNPKNGEIYDADIELNGVDFDLSLDGNDGVDLESILTHEMGHFLGLAHTATEHFDATMSATWDGLGSDLRSLSTDDEAAICTAYPPNRSTASNSCEPRNGFAKECDVALSDDDGGCSVSAAPASRSAAGFAACVALLAALGLRRRRS